MRLKLRMALLACLTAAAVFTGAGAYKTLRPVTKDQIPKEVYARFTSGTDNAQFFLKTSGDYVAVYESKRDRAPVTVTGIEISCLRGADRAMIEAGIPVSNRRELLLLLEDLGS